MPLLRGYALWRLGQEVKSTFHQELLKKSQQNADNFLLNEEILYLLSYETATGKTHTLLELLLKIECITICGAERGITPPVWNSANTP